jgi:hypothetical protein
MEAASGLNAIDKRFGGAPVPLSETVCGLLFAESWKLKVPERAPIALGKKVTEAAQLAPAASVAGLIGHVEVTPKSVELVMTEVIVSDEDWLLVNVTVFGVLVVPRAWLLKVNELGLAVAASTPVPVKPTVGLLLALSLTVSVPERKPAAAGVKTTEMVQLPPAAKVLGLRAQLVVDV